ncbi:acyl-CoA synthetase [Ferruginivarius sediminum]|uniref:AMP-dependent synthetase n=1 Tax=Ferruginivarius sediminum TaxID=2661937 RepID=A0A369TCA2_9PROT|nr:acyl-CoA synthetase [Ferruginivarius sediminum]RDD62908.1 AMP-dependent synthetase [Ferruginivarius sediminum]
MLPAANSYEELCNRFRWDIPARFNIGVAACDVWAARAPERTALIQIHEDGSRAAMSFATLRARSNRLANALAGLGIGRGDRVGILLPQCAEAAIAHLAVYKLGAVAVPLFTLFGEEALAYRLGDSGARALIATPDGLSRVAAVRDNLPDLSETICVGDLAADSHDFEDLLERSSDSFMPVDTAAEDPALVIYTSGTTGSPKGALHAHRVLLGHLPGVEMPQELFPKPGDLFWTPADWAWIGGLLDALLPSLAHGVPVLAYRFPKFDPEYAFALMAELGVRNAFMPPTALKMMRQVPKPWVRYNLNVRSIGSGGETLGPGLLEWGRETFGVTINEFYGQTECNLIVANCAGIMPVKPGSMGRPVPGHRVAIVDAGGNPLPAGQEGAVAVHRPDPAMFLAYLNKPEATAEKFVGDWLLTGDTARMDEDGYLWFVGRDDDVITSGGYRIGPGEIEDCLIKHPAVAMAAAVGVPDPVRTERVKAFVVLNDGYNADGDLVRSIQQYVKERLAAYEYPRDVEFVPRLPLTPTGKIKRKELRERGAAACAPGGSE